MSAAKIRTKKHLLQDKDDYVFGWKRVACGKVLEVKKVHLFTEDKDQVDCALCLKVLNADIRKL